MEPVIRRLIVEGFRSIRSEVVDFDNPTFLVGRNGSGKSNLIDALVFLSEAITAPLTEVFSQRGGGRAVCHGSTRSGGEDEDRHLGLGVVLENLSDEITSARYSLQISASGPGRRTYAVQREQCFVERRGRQRDWFDRTWGQAFRSSIGGLRLRLTGEALGLSMLGGDERFFPVYQALQSIRLYAIEPHRVRERRPRIAGSTLSRDGYNAANVLMDVRERDPDDLQRICELMEPIVPGLQRIDVREYGHQIGLEFTQRRDDSPSELTLDASSMSDGTLRALGLLAAVYQPQSPSVMAIEEPEARLHPGALDLIMDVLRFAGERTQVVATTHSPEILDADWLEDRHIRIVDWRDGATRVMPLDVRSREALRQHLMTAGELLRSNALDGSPPGPVEVPRPDLFQDIVA